MNQWQRSYPGRKRSKRESTVRTVPTKGIFFSVFSLSGRNAREGSPGRTLSIESIYGREKGRTPVAITGVGKRSNINRRCEVLLMNYQ